MVDRDSMAGRMSVRVVRSCEGREYIVFATRSREALVAFRKVFARLATLPDGKVHVGQLRFIKILDPVEIIIQRIERSKPTGIIDRLRSHFDAGSYNPNTVMIVDSSGGRMYVWKIEFEEIVACKQIIQDAMRVQNSYNNEMMDYSLAPVGVRLVYQPNADRDLFDEGEWGRC